jgi:hypothetical protein
MKPSALEVRWPASIRILDRNHPEHARRLVFRAEHWTCELEARAFSALPPRAWCRRRRER